MVRLECHLSTAPVCLWDTGVGLTHSLCLAVRLYVLFVEAHGLGALVSFLVCAFSACSRLEPMALWHVV